MKSVKKIESRHPSSPIGIPLRAFFRLGRLALFALATNGPFSVAWGEALSLEKVLKSVDTHYPLILSAFQEVEKSKGELKSAQGGFDTLLKSNYYSSSGHYQNKRMETLIEQPTSLWGTRLISGYRWGDGNFASYDEDAKTPPKGEVKVGIEIPLLRGGSIDERRAKIAAGEKGLSAAESYWRAQKLEAHRWASLRFYDWIGTGEKLRIAQKLLDLAKKRDEMMTHRVQKGDAAQIEQTDNRRSVLSRESTLIAARRSFDKSALDLSLYYRDEQGQPLVPSEMEFPEKTLLKPDPKAISEMEKKITEQSSRLKSILREHPELKRIEALKEQNEVQGLLAKNTILPKLDAEITMTEGLQSDIGVETSARDYKAGLKLEFPLLLRSGRGRFEAVSAQGLRLKKQYEITFDRLHIVLQDSLQAMETALQRISQIKEEIELALQVEHAERMKFQQGDSNILTINLRENTTADAKIRAIDALIDYYRARVEFETTLGGASL